MSLSAFKQNRDVLSSVSPKLWAVFDCCYTMKYNTSMNKGIVRGNNGRMADAP